MAARYEFKGAPEGFSSLRVHLSLDGSRFRLSVDAFGIESRAGVAPRREEWDYAGEWRARGREIVFRPTTCESRDWAELEVVSVEVAMMDQPFYQNHPGAGEFTAKALDEPSEGALPGSLLLSVPGEMKQPGNFKYAEVVITRDARA